MIFIATHTYLPIFSKAPPTDNVHFLSKYLLFVLFSPIIQLNLKVMEIIAELNHFTYIQRRIKEKERIGRYFISVSN